MNNTQFKEYLDNMLKEVDRQLKECQEHPDTAKFTRNELNAQREMLVSAQKIMTYGTGPERRRFRREYERRLTR